MVSNIVKHHSDSERGNPLPPLHGLGYSSFFINFITPEATNMVVSGIGP